MRVFREWKWKRELSGLLAALVLLLAGCGAGEPVNSGSSGTVTSAGAEKGRYVESELKIAGLDGVQIISGNLLDDGRYAVYGADGTGEAVRYMIDFSQDPPSAARDSDWKIQDDSDALLNLAALCGASTGETYAVYSDDQDIGYAKVMDGKLIPLERRPDLPMSGVHGWKALPDGSLLVLGYDRVTQLEPEGDIRQVFEGQNSGVGWWDGNLAILQGQDSPGKADLALYDAKTGELVRKIPCDPASGTDSVLAISPHGKPFLCNSKGLFRLNDAEDGWDSLIGTDSSSLSLPGMTLGDLIFLENGDFIVTASPYGAGTVFYRYQYDDTLSFQPERTLQIATFEDHDILHAAVPSFLKEFPQVQPDIRILSDGGLNRSDVVHMVNTELLAGKGADVYVMDYLPKEAFQEKGVLRDLSDLVQAHSGELLENIVRCYEADGKIPIVPLRFQVPTLFSGGGGMEAQNLSELADWAAAHPDKPLLTQNTTQGLFWIFYPACAPAWISEDGIDQVGMAVFLENIKQIADAYPVDPDVLRTADFNSMNADFQTGKVHAYEREVRLADDFLTYAAAAKKLGGGFSGLPADTEGPFYPYTTVGVNANSAAPDAAMRYVDLLLSEEIQGMPMFNNGHGLSVNRKVFDAHLQPEDWEEFVRYTSILDENAQFVRLESAADVPAVQEIFQRFSDLCASLKTPASDNQDWFAAVYEQAERYFSGAATAREAADAASEKINAMMEE